METEEPIIGGNLINYFLILLKYPYQIALDLSKSKGYFYLIFKRVVKLLFPTAQQKSDHPHSLQHR